MRNFLAIATVTATLQSILGGPAAAAVDGAIVKTERPEDGNQPGNSAWTGINIFLYAVSPNTAFRNADLPTRNKSGGVTQRPQIALDLHYLLTFYGNETDLEPQRLLGTTVNTLHAYPILTQTMIKDTIDTAVGSDPDHFLGGSDLAEQIETVKFIPASLNLEELSKLWSVFFQTPYSLSVAYHASVVLIEPEVTPKSTLPVRTRGLYTIPFQSPVITAVEPNIVQDGDTLLIRGSNLSGDVTYVSVGGIEQKPPGANVRNTKITVTLPAAVKAGVQIVQVDHKIMMGEPAVEHEGFASNPFPIVVQPTIASTSVPSADEVTVNFDLPVGIDQEVYLLLNGLTGSPPDSFRFPAPASNGITTPGVEETSSITYAISGVGAGNYLVRVEVDRVASPLGVDGTGTFDSPTVTIP